MKIFNWRIFTVIVELSEPWSSIAKSFLKAKSLNENDIQDINDVQYNQDQVDKYKSPKDVVNWNYMISILNQAKEKGRGM